jgi:Concanavalin A-like lectin/glucanases superfamily
MYWVLGLLAALTATLGSGSLQAALAQDTDRGRVVAYSFDSWATSTLVRDESGKQNHGTPVNFETPPVTEPGRTGNGLSLVFDRHLEQRIDVGSGAQPSLDLSTFTIAAWIRINESDTDERNWEIAEKADAYWLNVRNGHDSPSTAYRLRCGAIVDGKQYTVDSDIEVPHDGRWVHVAGTFNGTHLRVYIDGIPRGSRAVSGKVSLNDFPLTVGANNKPHTKPEDPVHNWLMGAMDDFRLYRRALSRAEIAAVAAW